MSVIPEAEPGDEIIVIEEFHASPQGESFSWKTCHKFQVGESVKFATFHQDQQFTNHPGLGWIVVFDASDGKRYAATQTFFVTMECWNRLKEYFKRSISNPRRPKASRK